MTDTNTGHPLITFALFTYNQEKFIREAVEGALSQTYEPLEIILSDDCSTDKTFEIMEQMVKTYNGPHTLRLNRNSINVGTAAHVSYVFSLSKGKLFVVAAGDDISIQDRVAKIVSAWQLNGSGKALIHSAMVQFDDAVKSSQILRRKVDVNDRVESLDRFVEVWRMPAYAPTCAYSREIFELFVPLTGGSLIEDFPLMVRSLAIAKIVYLDEPLVRARKLENSAGQGFTILQPYRWNRFIHSRMTALHDTIRDSERFEGLHDSKVLWLLRRKAKRKIVSHASLIICPKYSLSFIVRVKFMIRLIFGRAISGGLKSRLRVALTFSFPELHNRYRTWKKVRQSDL